MLRHKARKCQSFWQLVASVPVVHSYQGQTMGRGGTLGEVAVAGLEDGRNVISAEAAATNLDAERNHGTDHLVAERTCRDIKGQQVAVST